MVSAIVGMLPLGLGIALNPIAVVVSILIGRRHDPRRNGVAFVLAWMLGLALLVLIADLLIPERDGGRRTLPPTLAAWIWLGLGALLLLAAGRALRSRPSSADASDEQRWAMILGRGGTARTFGVGLFLSTISLRNLALLAAAAGVLSQADLAPPELAIAGAAFVAVSSLGVAIPLIVRLCGGPRGDAALERAAAWLARHLGTITAVVMALLGVYLAIRGVAGLVSTAR